MNTSNPLLRLPTHYWGYAALIIWGATVLIILRNDFYGLDEGAAKALLLLWSIADNVASSVVTLGMPDLRAILFTPAGALWTGSIIAPKVLSIIFVAYTAWQLYAWRANNADSERALLSTGLLLISPLTLHQIDSLAPGIYLLLAFALGAWLDKAYRNSPRPMGGWYFAQLFVSAFSVSLGPIGLAYPIALLWDWYKNPIDKRQQRFFFVGIIFVVAFTLFVRMGWPGGAWLQNPINHLASIVLGTSLNGEMNTMRWVTGSLILTALALTFITQFKIILKDFNGRTLLIALVLGISYCDTTWSMVALCVILYYGLPLLLGMKLPATQGFVYERGAALLAVLALSILFMRADKIHYEINQSGILSYQDTLIQAVVTEAEKARVADEDAGNDKAIKQLRVSSQWPSRTMMACKCDSLPLPPSAKDAEQQLTIMRSITYILFDPQHPHNVMLARNLSVLGGGRIETLSLQPGGVLLRFRSTDATPGTSSQI